MNDRYVEGGIKLLMLNPKAHGDLNNLMRYRKKENPCNHVECVSGEMYTYCDQCPLAHTNHFTEEEITTANMLHIIGVIPEI